MSLIIILVGVFIFNLKSPPTAQPRERLKKLKDHLGLSNSTRLKPFGLRKKPKKLETERQGILRGPSEAILASCSYTTAYSESMSYSYGSNSKEGVEILKKLNSDDENKEVTVAEVPEQTNNTTHVTNGHAR